MTTSETSICEFCEQEFRRRPDLIMMRYPAIKYCSRSCSNASRRRKYKTELIDYKCKTCDSLVRGTQFTKTRKHCTHKCKEIFGNNKTTKKIELSVEMIKPSEAMI